MSSHPPPSASTEAIVAYHNALKLGPQWDALPSIGVQRVGDAAWDLKNCRCGSTLARKVPR